MHYASFSIEDIPDRDERKRAKIRHHELHKSGETIVQSSGRCKKLGRQLLRSPDLDHQIDGAWVTTVAAELITDASESARLFAIARKGLEAARDLSTDPSITFKAALGVAYLPALEQQKRNGEVDVNALRHRVLDVNRGIAEKAESSTVVRGSLQGTAVEVAVLALLLNRAVETGDSFAWPSTPWQDAHYNSDGSRDFDIAFGSYPGIDKKIQVKSFLDQTQGTGRDNSDAEENLAYWMARYASDIDLIFGDVHLGLTREDPFVVNKMLLAPESNSRELSRITSNVMCELYP